ncbi:calcium-binding mitochondrial carrier protein Aralar2 isoform X1 [Selaginella moellendorffii]|uniref:calcium-binding mitochondrial carrier protein Aralar2 isoform X1 n=1 Tax=Selaginella moellendorffii TaxID=88036 RepID=UPI000D1CD94D|nr:calcium-binding mitochondrial carrier protein Aralar2 isoform X1 [Selaginella moellendorffii]|eukprot:XP_024532617.1 calcium-binding mitochondrial carrier protein Aralar2 isoform X1 [Selaginella moellendorffii]
MECVCCDTRPMQQLPVRAPRSRAFPGPELKSKLPRLRRRNFHVEGREVCLDSQQQQGMRNFHVERRDVGEGSREELWMMDWKPGVVTAAVVFSLSLPSSSPSALEIDRVSPAKQAEVARALVLDGARNLDRSLEVSVALNAPEVSIVPVTNKVVQAVARPKAVPVINPVVVSSSSRLLARILQHFGGGGIAGAIGAALVYPLDTIKTRMQAQNNDEECKYKNEIDCFRKLVADEGMGSLYSGLLPQLVGIAPEKAVKLTVNELLLELLEHVMPGTGLWFLELIAGSGGGFSQVVFTNPMEIVKVRLQTQTTSNKRGFCEVVKELGFRGLYHGAGVTLARDIPSSGIFFACYAILCQLYPDQGFADGFLAAIPATVLSTPMDVVKTRLQVSPQTPPYPIFPLTKCSSSYRWSFRTARSRTRTRWLASRAYGWQRVQERCSKGASPVCCERVHSLASRWWCITSSAAADLR